MKNTYDHVSILAQVAKPSKYCFKVGYASPQVESNHDILINSHKYCEFVFLQSENFTEIDLVIDYIKLEQIVE